MLDGTLRLVNALTAADNDTGSRRARMVVNPVWNRGLAIAEDRIAVGRSRHDRSPILFERRPILPVRRSAGRIAAHKQQGCGRKHCEEGRRLHGHCQLLSVLPKRGSLALSRSRVATYPRCLVSAIGIPPMRRMGSSGPTAQTSVDRRVRRVQRSISRNEAIVTDVTTSGS